MEILLKRKWSPQQISGHLGRERLLSANAIFGAVFNLVTFVGPSIGGIMIAYLGTDAIFYLVGVLYLVGVGVNRARASRR